MRKNEQWRDLSSGQVTACNFVGGQSSPNLYSMNISYGRKTGDPSSGYLLREQRDEI
jgi:hypothetical protein